MSTIDTNITVIDLIVMVDSIYVLIFSIELRFIDGFLYNWVDLVNQ